MLDLRYPSVVKVSFVASLSILRITLAQRPLLMLTQNPCPQDWDIFEYRELACVHCRARDQLSELSEVQSSQPKKKHTHTQAHSTLSNRTVQVEHRAPKGTLRDAELSESSRKGSPQEKAPQSLSKTQRRAWRP